MVRKKQKIDSAGPLSSKELLQIVTKTSGVIEAKVIRPSEVETAEWVGLKCQYGCDGYGQSLTCPPYTPGPQTMRKVLDCYRRGMLIHFTPQADVKARVAQLERQIFLLGAWKAFGLGAGPCYFCSQCPLETGQCTYPGRARPSMEACGIDVFSTVRKFNMPIEVVRTHRQCPNFYGLILVD